MTEQQTDQPGRAVCPVCGHDHQERPTPEGDAAILLAHASSVTDYQDERDPARTAKLLVLVEDGATIIFYERGKPVFPRIGGPLSFTAAYLARVGMQPVSAPASHQEGPSDVQR
jgi:hypothetical protein